MVEEAGEASYVAAAEKQIDRLVRANRKQRAISVIIGILVVLLIWVAWGQHQQALESCRADNSYRVEDNQIWDYFIGVLVAGNNQPNVQAQARIVENHIAQLDTSANCTSTWNFFG